MAKYGEPWTCDVNTAEGIAKIFDKDGCLIGSMHTYHDMHLRTIKCVNAMVGIDDIEEIATTAKAKKIEKIINTPPKKRDNRIYGGYNLEDKLDGH